MVKMYLLNYIKKYLINYMNEVPISYTKYCISKKHNSFIYRFTAHLGHGFNTLFVQYYVQCDLPPLRPHCGEALGRDSNLGRAI